MNQASATAEVRFAAARERFEAVARDCGDRLHTTDIELGGAPVRLRIVGDALAAAMTETFAHLQVAPTSPPALQIEVWSEDETGATGMRREPPLGDGWKARLDGGEVSISADEQYLTYRVGDNSVSWLDRRASRIVGSVRCSKDLLAQERVKPFASLLMQWLRDRGIRIMHAAALAEGERAILLPAPSGSGKSTCATACVDAGMRYLADDTVGLEEHGTGAFVVHSLYGGTRLWPNDGKVFPDWVGHAVRPQNPSEEPKLLLFVGRRYSNRLARRAPVDAIAFPRITSERDTRFRPLKRAEALRALVGSSLFLWLQPRPADIEQMLRLATAIPAFALELGSDRSQIAERVRECLQAAASRS